MRWSIIRLIWHRELRDQLRDRRTLFMIVGLPILLYPIAGFGMLQFAAAFGTRTSNMGVIGPEHLPQPSANVPSQSPFPIAGWFRLTPASPGCPLAGLEDAVGAWSLWQARHYDPKQDYPPLFMPNDPANAQRDRSRREDLGTIAGRSTDSGPLRLSALYLDTGPDAERFQVKVLEPWGLVPSGPIDGDPVDYLDRIDRALLETKQIDLLFVVPPEFMSRLEEGGHPPLFIVTRDGDERSRILQHKFNVLLNRWKKHLKQVRLIRSGLPVDFDETFEIIDRDRAKTPSKRTAEELFDLLVRIFPFVLVMWSLAGALYPAVDLCAGEKERGTMETLLISPASRQEIVWGKFLTIWVFSAATALLNLLSMGLTTWHFSRLFDQGAFRPSVLGWGMLLLLPLSAFFSAICLAVGVYARSSKEGQYYLMPLFLLTMPLIFLTLAPGVELNPYYSMVPVTGVALLLQKLMAAGSPEWEHGLYVIAVMVPLGIYCWLALRRAIEQFQREEVLFREAERIEARLWLSHLFRDKELLPTTGEAMFCFGLILVFRWVSLGLGGALSPLVREAIGQMAFVAAPPLFMALVLTSRPRQGIAMRLPPGWSLPLALVLGLALAPPLAELTLLVFDQFPTVKTLLDENRAFTAQLLGVSGQEKSFGTRGWYFLVLAVLPAVCEEVAFRGFILTGLARRFRPRTALLISSFLYAVYPMNLFEVLPRFFLGASLAFLVLRTNSIWPAVLAHMAYKALSFGVLLVPGLNQWVPLALNQMDVLDTNVVDFLRGLLAMAGAITAAVMLALAWLLSERKLRGMTLPTAVIPDERP